MQHTRGKYVIFADADGASKFEDLGKLSNELRRIEKDGLGVAVGSRAHMVHSAAVVQVHSQLPPKRHVSILSLTLLLLLRNSHSLEMVI